MLQKMSLLLRVVVYTWEGVPRTSRSCTRLLGLGRKDIAASS